MNLVEFYNNQDSIDGIIVQMPLPGYMNASKVQNSIDALKDVDGLRSMYSCT